MPVRWVICPVVETFGEDGTRYRAVAIDGLADPGNPGKSYAYTAVISDGLPGQVNDWALVQVMGADLSGLDAVPGVVDLLETDHDRSARKVLLAATVDGLGWPAAKLARVRDRLAANGVDVAGLTRQSTLLAVLRRLADAVAPGRDLRAETTMAGAGID
jgi:hypothetical protein